VLALAEAAAWQADARQALRRAGMPLVSLDDEAALWDALAHSRVEGVPFPAEALPRLTRTRTGIWPLVECLTRWQPRVLLLDLENAAVPWERWLPRLTSAAETRHIPVVCCTSGDGAGARAYSLGARAVWSRAQLAASAPHLLAQYARPLPDPAAQGCDAPLHPAAQRGIALFNRREFFAAHEALETAWRTDPSGRSLYQGILQVGVAYLQIERGNARGALTMFRRARRFLLHLPAVCRGVDVARLAFDAETAWAALLRLSPQDIARYPRGLFRPVAVAANAG